jgi:hypothetical protein
MSTDQPPRSILSASTQIDAAADALKLQRLEVAEPLAKAFINVATNAWRIRTKIMDPQTKETKEQLTKDEIRRIGRHLEAIFESFSAIKLEVKDRTNEPFDYGLPEKVIASQAQAGLLKEIVIETLRPTIIWGESLVQQGEVVIATPESTK